MVEHDNALNAMAVVVVGQCPILAKSLVHGVHNIILVVAIDVDVRDAGEGGGNEKKCKSEDLGKEDGGRFEV